MIVIKRTWMSKCKVHSDKNSFERLNFELIHESQKI